VNKLLKNTIRSVFQFTYDWCKNDTTVTLSNHRLYIEAPEPVDGFTKTMAKVIGPLAVLFLVYMEPAKRSQKLSPDMTTPAEISKSL
jgi:hypothetical protein